MLRLALGVGLLMVVGCGTTKNPNFCCLTEENCAMFGETEFRSCSEGLACIDNTCEPATCATGICEPAAPVCVIATDTCVGCTSSDDCVRFAALPVCDAEGACVECVGDSDCPVAKPICDAKQCRACVADDECASGACANDGTCVDEAAIVYLSTTGADVAPCTNTAPCATVEFALMQLDASREHVVFAPGNYAGFAEITIPAVRAYLHGHGARLTGGNSDNPTLRTRVPAEIQDIEIVNEDVEGRALSILATAVVERVELRGGKPLEVRAPTTITDTEIEASHTGVTSISTSLTLDRVRVHGGQVGIDVFGGTIDFTNLLLYETTGVGLNLIHPSGSVKFATIARTGRNGSGVFGAHCEIASVVFQGSIIWHSFAGSQPPVDGSCTQFVATIAGPATVLGAMNTNPQFVNEVSNDFHLGASSPARDALDAGPAVDLENGARPRGTRFDMGAFETP